MNIYRDHAGKWQSHVQVRRETNPELVSVIDRNPKAIEEHPDTQFWRDPYGRLRPLDAESQPSGEIVLGGAYSLYTRIYLGATPPVGYEPGFCAVVAEKFDGSFEPHQRPLVVLDEGVCYPDVDTSMALIPDLLEATAALKDIYLPSHEREDSTGTGADRRLIVRPEHEEFLAELAKSRHGICNYPDDTEVPEGKMAERWPFFASRDRIAPLCPPPYKTDEDYGIKMVESMVNRNDRRGRPMISYHTCCQVLRTSQYRTPLRAIALCCLTMQTYDWTEALEGKWDWDGYEIEQTPQNTARQRATKQEAVDRLMGTFYMASDAHGRSLIERRGRKGFLEALKFAGIEVGADE